jgi:hypothetical protein
MIVSLRRWLPVSCNGRAGRPIRRSLEQDRSDEADDGVLIGIDANHLGRSLDGASAARDAVLSCICFALPAKFPTP